MQQNITYNIAEWIAYNTDVLYAAQAAYPTEMWEDVVEMCVAQSLQDLYTPEQISEAIDDSRTQLLIQYIKGVKNEQTDQIH